MSNYYFYVVEIELPLVGGTCTIDGNLGYGTPLTCDDQAPNFNTYNYSYKFTDSNLPIGGEVYKVVKSVSETTPQLKAGNGVGSRATATINFSDFIGDPNINRLPSGLLDPIYKQGVATRKECAPANFAREPDHLGEPSRADFLVRHPHEKCGGLA